MTAATLRDRLSKQRREKVSFPREAEYVPGMNIKDSTITILIEHGDPQSTLRVIAEQFMAFDQERVIREAGLDLATFLELHPEKGSVKLCDILTEGREIG